MWMPWTLEKNFLISKSKSNVEVYTKIELSQRHTNFCHVVYKQWFNWNLRSKPRYIREHNYKIDWLITKENRINHNFSDVFSYERVV